uniref:Uncharacterized protein n=1 Tax=Anguilla anguilla TaxID=7936 RepID=A0A0E9PAW4_ANGAN
MTTSITQAYVVLCCNYITMYFGNSIPTKLNNKYF